jgi:signal transduction histidine kinase
MEQSIQTMSNSRRFILGVVVVALLSLLVFYAVMNPPVNEIGLMALFLSITAGVSIVAAYLAYRLRWIEKSPNLLWTILGGYILSSLLTFINVWLTARLMFADYHDLLLATILLVFASGIAIVFGYFFAAALSDRINSLQIASRYISQGDFDHRVEVRGKDELAELSQAFNHMAERLQIAEQRKQELDRLRRDLVAWSSHDLQTPLASVQAIIEALADDIVEDDLTAKRYLRTAQKDIRALSLLIDDLSQMAQIDAGGLQIDKDYSSIMDLISDTLETFRKLADQKQIQLDGLVDEDIDPVFMDTLRIGRVLNNLISNALHHTNEGGNIRVCAHRQPNKVLVEVIDSGSGISPGDLPFIFDRFYRGDKARSRVMGGSGLGLAISKGIIQAHGGEIGVESQPGITTRFWFWIPNL